MKKRVLSLFMALMLCLTLLPTAALAEELEALNGTPSASVADADAEADAQNGGDAADQNGEDGVSVQSGGDGIAVQAASAEKTGSSVASVVIDGTTYYYNTLREAIMAAGEKAGSDGTPPTITLLQDGVELRYPQYNSDERRDDPTYPVIVDMGGNSLSSVYFLYDTLTLTGGTVNGTWGADIRSGGSLIMTAPADADAAINGLLQVASVGSGTANVSGAKIGVKGKLYIYTSAAKAVVISGSEKAVELSEKASLPDNCCLYGSTEENGSPDTVAVYSDGTYTVDGVTAKTLVSGPQAVVAVTPGDTLSVMAGEAQEYTAQYTAEGVVTGSVKGLGDLKAEVENADGKGITVTPVDNGDGTWTVTVQTTEETDLGDYTLKLWSEKDGAVSGSVQFKVSETKYAASVGEQNYRSLSAAVEAAKTTSGTVKLLDNVTGSITVTEGSFTIDLNGKTWTAASGTKQTLTVNGGEVTLSSTGGVGTVVGSDSNNKYAVRVDSGTVHLKENVTLSNRIYIADQNGGSVTFEPGVTVTQNIMTSSSYITKFLTDLALQNASSDYVPFYNVRTNEYPLGYVTVVAHDAHHWVDGVCDQCGYVCGHSNANAEDKACPDCGAAFIAAATAADGTVTRYTNADAALAAAAGSAKIEFVKGTYTLKNAVSFSGEIETEIDLNEATLQYASGDQGVVLLMDGNSVSATIKNGTIRNTGEGTGIYLYKGSTLTLENVTVIGGVDTSFNTQQEAVHVASGNTLTVKSGDFTGPLDLNLSDSTVKLYGGTYQNGITGSMYRDGSWQYKLSAEGYAALLDNSDPAKQYAYADGANGAVISYATVAERMNDSDDTNNSIRVVEHTHAMGGTNTCTACGFVCTAHQYKNGVCAICKAECPHANVDTSTRVCSDCRLTMVAAVTVKDSENNDVTTYTADLAAAMNKAADGTTFTLLADVTLNKYIDVAGKPAKTLTLDLQDHTIHSAKFAVGELNIGDGTAGTLKITGSGSLLNEYTTILVWEDGKLDLTDWSGDTISGVGLGYNNKGSVAGKSEPQITVGADAGRIGSLEFRNWYVSSISASTLEGGSYDQITMNTDQQSVNIETLLPMGYAFQKNDGTLEKRITAIANRGAISNVSVVKCTAHETEGESANCIYCNADAAADAAAKVQTKDGRTVYCTDLQTAIVKAAGGGTVKLLKNVTLTESVNNANSENVTLDLNNCTITSSATVLNVWSSGMTICDSSEGGSGRIYNDANERGTAVYVQGGSLTIQSGTFEAKDDFSGYALCAAGSGSADSVTITGGTFKGKVDANISTAISGGTFEKNVIVYPSSSSPAVISGGTFTSLLTYNGTAISSLLADGYGFKSGANWLTETELAKTSAANVTVEAAPLHSVRLTANKTSVEYGLSQTVKLDMSCTTDPAGAVVSQKWYSVAKDGTTSEVGEGTSYALPAGLEAEEYTYRVTVTDNSTNYSVSKDITITVTKADLSQGAAVFKQVADDDGFNNGNINDGEGTFVFTPYSGNADSATKWRYFFEVSCNGRKLTAGSDYTVKGGNTAQWAGTYTLTIEGKGNYTGTAAHQWEIKPYTLSKDSNVARIFRTYDGTTNLSAEQLIRLGCFLENLENRNSKNPILGADHSRITIQLGAEDFEVSNVKLGSAEAGDTTASFTIKLKPRPGQTVANFVFEDGTSEMTVKELPVYTAKAFPPSPLEAGKLNVANNHPATYTVDLSALLPALEAPREYGAVTYGAPTVNLSSDYYTVGTARIENGKLILPIQAVETSTESNIGTVTVKVTSGNIVDFYLTVNVSATNKIVPTGAPTLSKTALTYGEKLGSITLSGSMKEGDKAVPGEFTWTQPDAAPVAGEYTVEWKFTPEDTATYLETTGTVTITVNKATPAGKPQYTAIKSSGKTLKDAVLAANESWPEGTIQWVDKDGKKLPDTTEVKANTAYKWIFTPDAEFAANYTTAEGTVILYSVSTGGGGGGGSTTTTTPSGTVTNPDGSTTKTETKADGTVVETTTAKDGSTTTTTTKKDGSSVTESKNANGSTGTVKTDKNGRTEASAKISDKAVSDAKNSGDAVKVPAEVKAGTNSSSAPTVKIDLPAGSGETKIEIPVSNVNTGTVAVIVHPDGTEEIMKDSIPTENGVQLTVSGDATVKVMDNSKNFTDTAGHWSEKNIDFVSARGLLNGTSANTFSPNAPTTRAQLWTVLARQADADLTGGANWFEKAQAWSVTNGISDGANPSGAISRAQMVAMLWRADGSPEPKAAAGRFSDVAASSYYADAVAWAVENGITTGTKDGRFDPYASCTRAQIAAFLYRLYLSR